MQHDEKGKLVNKYITKYVRERKEEALIDAPRYRRKCRDKRHRVLYIFYCVFLILCAQ